MMMMMTTIKDDTHPKEVTCHMGSHSVTCHLTQVKMAGLPQPESWYSIYISRRDGKLS